MSRPQWFVELLKIGWPKNPAHLKITRIPFIERLLESAFFDGDELICLPQDATISIDEDVPAPGDVVLPSQVVHHFIDQADYHCIMNFCICRQAAHCRDFPIDYGCIFLGESAAGINPHMGHRATKDEAHAYARRVREAGLVHMMGRTKFDTWWLGVGPGEKLLTICNCCPCCCMSRFLAYSGPHLQAKLHRMPGVRVVVNEDCIGCGACTAGICFARAIHIDNGRAVIDQEACRGCGRCVTLCRQAAITLTVDPVRSVATSIDRIARLVDLS